MGFSRIARRLDLGAGESAVSLVSRLAIRCGCASSMQFTDAHGVLYRELVSGRDDIIGSLAEASGVDYDGLRRHSLRRGTSGYDLNGVAIAKSAMQRSALWACPICLAEDIRDVAKPSLAAYGVVSLDVV